MELQMCHVLPSVVRSQHTWDDGPFEVTAQQGLITVHNRAKEGWRGWTRHLMLECRVAPYGVTRGISGDHPRRTPRSPRISMQGGHAHPYTT